MDLRDRVAMEVRAAMAEDGGESLKRRTGGWVESRGRY